MAIVEEGRAEANLLAQEGYGIIMNNTNGSKNGRRIRPNLKQMYYRDHALSSNYCLS